MALNAVLSLLLCGIISRNLIVFHIFVSFIRHKNAFSLFIVLPLKILIKSTEELFTYVITIAFILFEMLFSIKRN